LGFRQRFGISASIWDFGNDLGFGIWNLGFRQNSEIIFRHISIPKLISAYIGFGTQVYYGKPFYVKSLLKNSRSPATFSRPPAVFQQVPRCFAAGPLLCCSRSPAVLQQMPCCFLAGHLLFSLFNSLPNFWKIKNKFGN
jgi:hypothetical protein